MGELFRALGVLAESPGRAHRRVGRLLDLPGEPDPVEHTRVFVLELYPYASVYLGAEGMMGGEVRDRIAGFWRALSAPPPPEPDHVSALLGLYASLKDAESREPDPARQLLCRHARRTCLFEHLSSWVFPFLGKAEAISAPFYAEWARMVRSSLESEILELGRLDGLPVALGQAASLADPREGGGTAFLRGLLSPARSGIILTRWDLSRAAKDLGLGLRQGERRYILQAFLSQAVSQTLDWLAREAGEWWVFHRNTRETLGAVSTFWEKRASRTRVLVQELSQEVPELLDSVSERDSMEVGDAGN
jgi:hypothetical protein